LDCILAVDIGSSSARALLFGSDGQEISGFESHIPYQARTAEAGEWEIDAAALTQIAAQAIDAIYA
jgi:gluconokinase